MTYPLVSIVTPSYNQAAFLETTLQSVLGQDYANLEYLVVDGASTDGSVEIIQKYQDRLAGWVSEKDAGQAEAINKGLQRARGEIVAWLNSDDLYLPGAVSKAVAALEANPRLGLVYGDALTIDPEGRPLNRLAFGEWGLDDLLRFRIICQPAVFMRREVVAQAGYLDPSYHCMLDHHLWLRMARRSPVQHLPALLAAARHHPGAKNVAQAPAFGQETLRLLDWLRSAPEFAELAAEDAARIEAGAQRLNARYLLDGGYPALALQAYRRALALDPPYALRHGHRMAFALASLVGGQGLREWYARLAEQRRPSLDDLPELAGWPGLRLEE